MGLYDLFLLLHLLLFCYWLGGDLGVFYSSSLVVDTTRSDAARLAAARIMINLDLVPRICMSLMLTVGGVLAHLIGYTHPPWQFAGLIALGPLWLAMVLTVHLREGSDAGRRLARIDYWFRVALVVNLVASVVVAFRYGRLAEYPWLAAKLLIFAFLVACGILIRRFVGPYVAGVHALATSSATDETNRAMTRSLARCKPFVVAIWIGLILSAWLGISKPGL